jgi:hypothetical protein
MSSEFTFFHCHFGGTTKSGLLVANFNSLQHQIFGGQFQNCSKGIHVAAGSVPVIHGVGFQGNEYDINVQNSVGDGMSIHSCRLEGNTPASHTFAWLHAGINAHIAGCTDSCDNDTNHFLFTESGGGPTPPSYATGVGNVCIDSCTSVNGDIIGNGRIFIRSNAGNKAFGNPDYLANFNGLVVENNRGPITVAQLTAEFPPAAKFKGLRQFVTDANATAFMGNVAGGGANSVPVICDGTNWKIG